MGGKPCIRHGVRVQHVLGVFGVFGVLRFPVFPLLHCLTTRQHVSTKYVVWSVITRVSSKDLLFVFSPFFSDSWSLGKCSPLSY